MAILQYKVVSYRTSTGGEPYLHGYFDTREVADRVCNIYNFIWSERDLHAQVEKA